MVIVMRVDREDVELVLAKGKKRVETSWRREMVGDVPECSLGVYPS